MALTAIMIWYGGLGVLAAIGTIAICRARFSPRAEHIIFALLLAPVAAMYLVFLAYFDDQPALRLEVYAVGVFVALGLLGLRLPALLVLGYALHGAWDLMHEISAQLGAAGGGSRNISAIPLAYGAFCAAYDWWIAGYFVTRQAAWRDTEAGA